MAATSNATLLRDLVDPEVIADYVDSKLTDAIRLSPLAKIDTTLVGRPGDEVLLPQYTYVGDAVSVAEGQDIPIAKLSQTTDKVKIEKIGKAIEYSDEAVLSAFNNDIATEAANQILVAINSGVEASLVRNMRTSVTLTANVTATGDASEAVADALIQFGEDVDGGGVIAVPPATLARFRKSKSWIPNTEIGAEQIIRGTFGMIYGYQVITMNRLNAHTEYTKTTDTTVDTGKTYYVLNANGGYKAVVSPTDADIATYFEAESVSATGFIIKPDALAIYAKRDTLVELDRDILAEMNYIKGSKLFAPYVYNKSKLIKLNLL